MDTRRTQVGLRTLNDPAHPYLELIFVHGLMGDAQYTWTCGSDGATFWPEWLSEDSAFLNTRIHTYGYHETPVNGRAPVSKLRDIGVAMCSSLEHNGPVRNDVHVSNASCWSSYS